MSSVGHAATALTLTSSAFEDGGKLPAKYTCEGEGVSPPLAWSELPEGTRSLALVLDDPDAPDPKAPKMVWVHWVVYNLPPTTRALSENAAKTGLPAAAAQGVNDYKQRAYGPPCPPVGRHRYVHKLYALDITLPAQSFTKAELEAAIQGHVLAKAELVGTYQKGDR